MQQSIECSNEVCNCTINAAIDTEDYCSEACRELGEDGRIEGETCPCGHPQCDTAP
ncbi:MAG: hypothetical protein JO233_00990 [Candidatus Eremiobacteraeota bacterium]|nr:hypothetical protein [Candidatus Eremiobacteraeota bacterium]